MDQHKSGREARPGMVYTGADKILQMHSFPPGINRTLCVSSTLPPKNQANHASYPHLPLCPKGPVSHIIATEAMQRLGRVKRTLEVTALFTLRLRVLTGCK